MEGFILLLLLKVEEFVDGQKNSQLYTIKLVSPGFRNDWRCGGFLLTLVQ